MASKSGSNILNNFMNKIKNIFKSIFVNGRDIISTLVCIVAIMFVAQLITLGGDKIGLDLNDIKDFVFAIGKFATAALLGVGYLTHITFRQTFGKHDTDELMNSWKDDFSRKEKTTWFFRATLVGLAVAGLVLSIGV